MAGATVKLTTKNSAAIAARFYAADRAVQRGARKIVRAHGEAVHGLTRENMLAMRIFRTGRMYDRLRLTIPSDGLTFEVGWKERDFPANRFYPIFVVFGTRFMAARDPLFPARDKDRPYFRRDLAALLSDAARGRAR